jgi:hypothetical protein
MTKYFIALMMLFSTTVSAQDVAVLMKEAQNLDRALKEDEAFAKYKQVLALDPNNVPALVRCAELSAGIGARQADKKAKKTYYDMSRDYADKALAANPNSADANYARAVAAGKQTEVEPENKKIVANVKDINVYATKALSINPNHGRANYVLGKWHYEMASLMWAKRAALKVFFGGMPEATMEDAIKYMEKTKTLEPYFVRNFLDLAKAYKYDNKPAKAIEVLNQLTKLPNRTADDATLKAEGKKLLSEMQ